MSIYLSPATLPTVYAREIAIEVDLHCGDELEVSEFEKDDANLSMFQQMAVSCSFERCLSVYRDMAIDEEQKAALKEIYDNTKDWISGYVVGELMKGLENPSNSGRDRKEIAEIILECFGNKKSSNSDKQRGILIRHAIAESDSE